MEFVLISSDGAGSARAAETAKVASQIDLMKGILAEEDVGALCFTEVGFAVLKRG